MKERLKGWYRASSQSLKDAAWKFGVDRANRMAAAIAYRVVFALAPLLLIAVSVLGAVVGSSEKAQAEISTSIEEVAGEQVAGFIDGFIDSALSSGDTAALIGAVLLFWSATSLFLEMQNDLNDIFEVPYEHVSGLIGLAKMRGIGVLWAFGLGVGVLVVWLLNAVWRFFAGLFPENLSGLHAVIAFLAPLISVVILPFVFGLMFQTMTAAKVQWRAVWWGGLFTAIAFIVAAHGIGLYFTLFDSPTAIGFASSIVVVLFLAYLLSSVFLFGAEVTKVYSDHLDGLEAEHTPSRARDTEGG